MGVRSLQRKFKDILYFTQKIYLKNHLNSKRSETLTISYKKKKSRKKLKVILRENDLVGSCFIHPYSSVRIFSTPSFKTNHPLSKYCLYNCGWVSLILTIIGAHSVFWNRISATDLQEANCFSTYSAQLCIQLNKSLTMVAGHCCKLYHPGIDVGQWASAQAMTVGRDRHSAQSYYTIYFQQI